jgi:hypothetical protein
MAGSIAEERIRAKAEALLRRRFPDARIVHELVLEQGGVRIDIAAIRPGFLAALEIKSERDTLKRLPEQIKAALKVCDLFGVCIAAKHEPEVGRWPGHKDGAEVVLGHAVDLLIEQEDGFDCRHSAFCDGWRGNRGETRLCNPADRLEMLWAEELKLISRAPKMSRQPAKHLICETMTGRQIREAVCAALRARPFPRADPAIPFPLLDLAA